jgi:aminoglycoside 3-N-acetyltransferase
VIYTGDLRRLGVEPGYGTCTAFHLAEYRQPNPPLFEFGAAVRTAGGRHWVTYTDVTSPPLPN